jgi:hypothetical protein
MSVCGKRAWQFGDFPWRHRRREHVAVPNLEHPWHKHTDRRMRYRSSSLKVEHRLSIKPISPRTTRYSYSAISFKNDPQDPIRPNLFYAIVRNDFITGAEQWSNDWCTDDVRMAFNQEEAGFSEIRGALKFVIRRDRKLVRNNGRTTDAPMILEWHSIEKRLGSRKFGVR